jgi:tight adherence protein B
MTRVSRKTIAGVLAALTVLVGGPASAFADAPDLTPLTSARFPDRAFVLTLPSERPLAADDVEVLEDGEVVASPSLAPADSLGRTAFGNVLVIDASKSMRGDAITGAMAAAQAFAGRRKVDQRLGVILFNERAVTALPLTADQAEIDAALASAPRLEGGTAIHEAALAGVEMLRKAQIAGGSVVLLSDGADTSKAATLPDVFQAAHHAGVRVFTVGLESGAYRPRSLEALADATGGAYALASSPRALAGIFDRLGAALSSQYLLRYRSFAGPRERVTLEVRVRGEDAATANYTSPALSLEPAPAFRRSVSGTLWLSPAAAGLVAIVGGLLIGAITLLVLRRRGNGLLERLSHFVPKSDHDELHPRSARRRLRAPRLSGGAAWDRFTEDLDVAQIRAGAGMLALLSVAGGAVIGWLLAALAGAGGAAAVGLAVPVAMRLFVSFRAGRERRAFADQLADNVQIIASAMRAGHSFVGALNVVLEEAAEPSRREFQRVVNDERLGKPIEQAFAELAGRMRNDELDHLGLVARLQTETGGNTSEVLDRLVETLRERGELRRLVGTLTAQGRLGGWVVGSLPIVLLVALSVLSPGYAQKIFETGSGNVMLMVSAVLIGLGLFAIRRIVDIKV